MLEDDRRKAVNFIVNDVYVPALLKHLDTFVKEYASNLNDAHALAKLFNRDVPMKPARLDLRRLHTELVDNIVSYEIIVNKHRNEKPTKQTEE